MLGENCSCITQIAISTDGKQSPPHRSMAEFRVWNIQTGKSRTVGECHGVTAIGFTSVVITGSEDGTVRAWNTDRF
jgi:WD40 repeat protein